jgi:hypothetical protein
MFSAMQSITLNVCHLSYVQNSEVKKLVHLLLVSPASSAEAERSFSALRRLKTWLRSTMIQQRLKSLAVCLMHHEILDFG